MAQRWDLRSGFGGVDLPVFADVYRARGDEFRTAGIHRAGTDRGLFGQGGISARADACPAEGGPPGSVARYWRALRAVISSVRRLGRDRFLPRHFEPAGD